MAFLTSINECLEKDKFSINMLDYFRMVFQYGGFTDEDCFQFKKSLSKKIREELPELDPSFDEVLAVLCIERGVHEIEDVLLFDDVAYSKKLVSDPTERHTYVNYIGGYGYDQTYYDYMSQILTQKQVRKDTLKKLAISFHEIFQEHFNDGRFPETLDWDEIWESKEWEARKYPYIEFALNKQEEELARLLKSGKSFTFKIASKILKKDSCCVLEVEYSPDEEKVLKVITKTTEPVTLSSLLERKKEPKKRELTQ